MLPWVPAVRGDSEASLTSCAVDSPTGINVECTVGRQNILPLEPLSVLTHVLCAISELYARYHTAIILVMPVT